MSEKKQLLLISVNNEMVLEMKESLSPYFNVVNVESVHVGYSIALELLPDLIFIDISDFNLPGDIKNISSFRSTHFLVKSWIFLLAPDKPDKEIIKEFDKIADGIFLKSTPFETIYKRIISNVYSKNSLSNYWKDCFMGMFNFMPKPVLLLEQNNILAMNDEFKQIFRPLKSKSHRLTDFVDIENRAKLEISLRNFSRGKYMRETVRTSLLLSNNKVRNAFVNFSKLKKGMDDQFILMIDFSGSDGSVDQDVNIKSANVENCTVEANNLCDFNFTKREKEIIELLCKGYKTKEISSTLFISPKTIEKHRSNIIKKTKSDTMLESIIYAINHNLIEVSGA
ncbi:LuxR C-terminal-related transcriptional regulator [Autumnicola psychrophila]|uniref:LuxR C-terminal-related transcriptional regulator n=1 Tax=Autumnicola psychrophila TaxID=3075592 RepID=A0ABU3DSK1_9FLAO|nr:LuxR C-terminal-related transcriptional regulator [Zunongwangia sp. F225]MDT0686679.1 LuxR C-terminal-related transcriptional regulator [Zunongwangia sp. F225]